MAIELRVKIEVEPRAKSQAEIAGRPCIVNRPQEGRSPSFVIFDDRQSVGT